MRIATIGTFDGLHIGHRSVIQTLIRIGREQSLQPVVFAFANHPLDIIAPQRRPGRLQDVSEQQRMLHLMGVEVQPIHFTPELMKTTSRQYMQMLHDKYDVRAMVIGYDNRFGHDREAGFDDYLRYGREIGIEVFKAPEMPGVSSSAIRKMLSTGDVGSAARALGYNYNIAGTVVHGKELGRTIGFPTANINPADPARLIPANGVYACTVKLHDNTMHGAMANIGHCPTVQQHPGKQSIEVNIFDFDGNLYGQTIELSFVARLRNEMQLPSVDALKQQLQRDKLQTELILKGSTINHPR